MKRQIIAWVLSLSIVVQPALAKQAVQTLQQMTNEFIKINEFSKRSVSLREFYDDNKKLYSFDMQREIEQLLKEEPAIRFPKANVVKLQEGQQEIIQMEFESKGERVLLRFGEKGGAPRLIATKNGRKIEMRLGNFEMNNPVRALATFMNKRPWTETVPSVRLLTTDEVKKLGAAEKRKYVDTVRELLASAEKVQNALQLKGKSAASLWTLFSEEAVAAATPSGSCIVAGWVGSYQKGSCAPPSEAKKGDCIRCNNAIYGENEACFKAENGKIASNATEQCNSQTEKNKYAIFNGVKNDKDVKARHEKLDGILTQLSEKCTEIEAGVSSGTKLPEQTSTCATYKGRIADLKNADCEILKKDAANFQGLTCQAVTPEPAPAADKPVSQPIADLPPDDRPPAQGGGGEDDCNDLPSNQSELRCSKYAELQCPDGPRYFCMCAPNEEPVNPPRAAKAIACNVRAATAQTYKERFEERKAKKASSEMWWTIGKVALVGALGVGAYYWWRSSMDTANKNANSPQPQNPVAPWVTPTTVITTPTPGTIGLPTTPSVPQVTPGTR